MTICSKIHINYITKYETKCHLFLLNNYSKQVVHGPFRLPKKPIQIIKHICYTCKYLCKAMINIIKLVWRGNFNHLLFDNWMVLICKTLSQLHPTMLFAKFGWNWLSASGEDLKILWKYFCYFGIISPFKKGMTLHLNKIDSPSPKNALWEVWLKLARWFLRRGTLNCVNICLSLFNNYILLKNKVALHLKKLKFLSPKDASCQV